MRRAIKTVGLFVAVAACLVLLLGWDVCGYAPIPSIRGRLDAERDVSKGRYRVLGYGLPAPWRANYQSLLLKKYGVQFHAVAGCIVSKAQVDYVAAYDQVSENAAKRRFGRDIFEEASNEASQEWKLGTAQAGAR